MLLFWNLFGSNQNLCVLKQNLLHLSNNHVIKPIIMWDRNNIFLPTSPHNSIMANLRHFTAILCCSHLIITLWVPNFDSINIFSAIKFDFDINCQRAIHLFVRANTCIHDYTNCRYSRINQFSVDKKHF